MKNISVFTANAIQRAARNLGPNRAWGAEQWQEQVSGIRFFRFDCPSPYYLKTQRPSNVNRVGDYDENQDNLNCELVQ
jgi:hypothetical protein